MPDAFDEIDQQQPRPSTTVTAPAPSSVPTPSPTGDAFDQLNQVNDSTPPNPSVTHDPRKTGEIVSDIGQKVIVPKDGESFADTLKRAVAYHKSLTPGQQKAALDAETKTMPKKAAQTLGAAATIGALHHRLNHQRSKPTNRLLIFVDSGWRSGHNAKRPLDFGPLMFRFRHTSSPPHLRWTPTGLAQCSYLHASGTRTPSAHRMPTNDISTFIQIPI